MIEYWKKIEPDGEKPEEGQFILAFSKDDGIGIVFGEYSEEYSTPCISTESNQWEFDLFTHFMNVDEPFDNETQVEII